VRRKEQRSSDSTEKMVTTPKKLNVDHLKSHLISEPNKRMERNGIKDSDGVKRR
jgi:hypothetical protein